MKIYAAPAVRAVLDPHASWEWADGLADGGFVPAGGLVATAHPVGATVPAGPGWTAYRVEDLASGRVPVYAPCVGAWSPVLDELCADADCVLLDGTGFSPGETATVARPAARQAVPGRLPVGGPDGSPRHWPVIPARAASTPTSPTATRSTPPRPHAHA
ncbi:hypothetical protein [Streptomyces sp. NRRL S-1022]|uniref:hypothetical protein n=1 Tax=Streptomyces sp. NRRL S-1022 TaxID=1463880 RepID=UPI0007C56395|nr:hypothetical protein [Streptomyces sp. NRRL S-1022]